MKIFQLSPVIISFILLGAHFSRGDNIPLMILSLAFPFLLLIKRKWITRIIQIILILGSIEWIRTIINIVQDRKSAGESWSRMALILAGVVLITALSSLVFFSKTLKTHYKSKK